MGTRIRNKTSLNHRLFCVSFIVAFVIVMNGTHFYLTLPSNASLSVFPDNTTASYQVKLPQTVELSGDWEVGLYSMTYPRTWYNLQDGDNHIYYSDDGYIFLTAFVDYGYYETMKDLVKSVNTTLSKETKGNVSMTFDVRTEKVTVHLKNGYQLAVTGKISILLGFGGKEVKITKKTVSPYVADINGAMNSIYAYCDIVQPQVVGGSNVKLLRTVPIEGKKGDVVTRTYNNMMYVPVQTKSFENIEILLRSDTGIPIPFERGKVLTTLHFRQQNSPYFM